MACCQFHKLCAFAMSSTSLLHFVWKKLLFNLLCLSRSSQILRPLEKDNCCFLTLILFFLPSFLLGFLMYWIVHLPPDPCALFSLYLLNTFECAYCIFFELEFKLVGGIITSLASLTASASVICLEYSSCCFSMGLAPCVPLCRLPCKLNLLRKVPRQEPECAS